MFAVISTDFGILPLAICASYEEAKTIVDQLTERKNHGAIFFYPPNQVHFIGPNHDQPSSMFDNGLKK
jgi:hypothetical protein